MPVFLYIEEIRGDATEADHQGEIELSSATFAGGQSGGHGQLKVQELAASKQRDSASTALWKAAVSGQIFAFMILDFVKDGHTVRFTMRLVALSGMSFNSGVEFFNLNFETFSVEHL
jgi:type VI protein secretion system component Hcp